MLKYPLLFILSVGLSAANWYTPDKPVRSILIDEAKNAEDVMKKILTYLGWLERHFSRQQHMGPFYLN